MQAYCRDDVLGFNLNLNLRAAIVKNEKSWSLMCVFLRLFLHGFMGGDFFAKKIFSFRAIFFRLEGRSMQNKRFLHKNSG